MGCYFGVRGVALLAYVVLAVSIAGWWVNDCAVSSITPSIVDFLVAGVDVMCYRCSRSARFEFGGLLSAATVL